VRRVKAVLRPQPLAVLCGSALTAMVLLTGCTRDFRYQPLGMWDRARVKPYEASPIPGETSSSRELPPGTVALGTPAPDDPFGTGRLNGRLVTKFPIPVNRALLEKGQERFNVYCMPCHGRIGDGKGLVVTRGFPHPPDYAIKRLRNAPVGHFFEVMRDGWGVMYSYASRINPTERWAIAAYIRALQAQRPLVTEDLYAEERQRARERAGVVVPPEAEQEGVNEMTAPPTGAGHEHGEGEHGEGEHGEGMPGGPRGPGGLGIPGPPGHTGPTGGPPVVTPGPAGGPAERTAPPTGSRIR
jgi:hypothetical protein